jgi:hypothetical protein
MWHRPHFKVRCGPARARIDSIMPACRASFHSPKTNDAHVLLVWAYHATIYPYDPRSLLPAYLTSFICRDSSTVAILQLPRFFNCRDSSTAAILQLPRLREKGYWNLRQISIQHKHGPQRREMIICVESVYNTNPRQTNEQRWHVVLTGHTGHEKRRFR